MTAPRYVLARRPGIQLDVFATRCGLHPDMVRRLVALGLVACQQDARGACIDAKAFGIDSCGQPAPKENAAPAVLWRIASARRLTAAAIAGCPAGYTPQFRAPAESERASVMDCRVSSGESAGAGRTIQGDYRTIGEAVSGFGLRAPDRVRGRTHGRNPAA